MKRFLALLGAVAMVGVALLIRAGIDGDGFRGSGGGGGGGGDVHAICATELEQACQALAEQDDGFTFDVEEAGDTAERLTADDFDPNEADFDGWLTLEPWPELVDLRRDQAQRGALFGETAEVLATSPLAAIGPTERIEALVDACDGEDAAGWNCFGDIAGDPWAEHGGELNWGAIDVGHADPTVHAAGLLVLGQAASDYFGTSDFARNDFGLDPDFRSWLRNLETADPGLPPTSDTPLKQLVRVGASSWDAVGDLDAADREDLSVLYPSPKIRAEVVLIPIGGDEIDVSEDDLRASLDDAGWKPGGPPRDTPEPPSAGVFEALLGEWEQATR